MSRIKFPKRHGMLQNRAESQFGRSALATLLQAAHSSLLTQLFSEPPIQEPFKETRGGPKLLPHFAKLSILRPTPVFRPPEVDGNQTNEPHCKILCPHRRRREGGGGTSAVTWRRHGESAFRAKLRNTPPHLPTRSRSPKRAGQ